VLAENIEKVKKAQQTEKIQLEAKVKREEDVLAQNKKIQLQKAKKAKAARDHQLLL